MWRCAWLELLIWIAYIKLEEDYSFLLRVKCSWRIGMERLQLTEAEGMMGAKAFITCIG